MDTQSMTRDSATTWSTWRADQLVDGCLIYTWWFSKKNHHICVGEITMMLSFNLYTGWILLNMVLKKMCVSHKIPSKKIHHIQGVGISDSCTQTKHATSQNSSSSWWIALHFAERATIASIRLIWPYQQDTITMACCNHVPFQPKKIKAKQSKMPFICHSIQIRAPLFFIDKHFKEKKQPPQPWSHRRWVSQYCHKAPWVNLREGLVQMIHFLLSPGPGLFWPEVFHGIVVVFQV